MQSLLSPDRVLVLPAVWDVLSAVAAKTSGCTGVYLSGAALANSQGLPDLGMMDRGQVVNASQEIRSVVQAPVMVDCETGFGEAWSLVKLVEDLLTVDVTSIMLEDQEFTGQSRPPNAQLAEPDAMCSRIRIVRVAAQGEMGILARTDILNSRWPLENSIARLERYVDAGADWVVAVNVRSADELLNAR